MRTIAVACVLILLIPLSALSDLEILDVVSFVPPENARAPWGVDVDEENHLAYVAGLQVPYHLAVIDAETHEIVGNVPLSGAYPHGVATYPEIGRVYVTNTSPGDVSVIDTSTQTEIATVPVGYVPMAACVNEATGLLYVPRLDAADVVVIDTWTNVKVDTITVGAYPIDVCANPTTSRVYVANLSDGTVSVIDGFTNQVLDTVAVGPYPEGIAANEITNLIYVANRDGNNVSVIDGATNQVVNTITVGQEPRKVAVDAQRNLIFVVNTGSQDVSVIQGGTEAVIATIPVGAYPAGGVAVDQALGYAFVTNHTSDDVSVIDGEEFRVVATVRLGWFPHEIAFDHAGRRWATTNGLGNNAMLLRSASGPPVWDATVDYSPGPLCAAESSGELLLSQPAHDRVLVLDIATGAVTDTIAVGDSPEGICANEATGRVYVANSASSSVSVIDRQGGSGGAVIPLFHSPIDVAVNTVTNTVYATAWFGMLYVIDGLTNTVVDSLFLHGICEPQHIAVNEATNRIYVAALNCNAVWVVKGTPLGVEAEVIMPGFPDEVCVSEELGRAYVCAGESLAAIEPDNTLGQVLDLGRGARGCALDREGSIIYVGCPVEGDVVLVWDSDGTGVTPDPDMGSLSLQPAWPNPFASSTGLTLSVPAGQTASLRIYDVRGALVRTLLQGEAGPGTRAVVWDGTNERGQRVASGVYLARLETADGSTERKVCVLE